MKRSIIAATILLAIVVPVHAQDAAKSFTYKKTKQVDLAIYVHYPPDWTKEDKRPAIVFFFGGG